MWNETDTPLAYLITFRTYGTWLHGDPRGSTNRFRNKFGTRFLPKEDSWLATNQSRLKGEPVLLNSEMRKCVENAIRETSRIRNWAIYAINVRTNHVHTVVAIGSKNPSVALNAFKANATRELRSAGLIAADHGPWSERGSKRFLWNEKNIADAVDYVLNGQGDDLPDFL